MEKALWIAGPAEPDTHVAFRGTFALDAGAELEIRLCGASWFLASVDGRAISEGAPRFDVEHPEYLTVRLRLEQGQHVLAVHVLHEGVSTKRMPEMPPFLWARVLAGGVELPVRWRAAELRGYRRQVRRINHDMGWIDWCDTAANPEGWQHTGFDDEVWVTPEEVCAAMPEPAATTLSGPGMVIHALTPLADGMAAEDFGYDLNDPPVRFFLRDLSCSRLPPQGVWRRYDLGRVRLGRPRFVIAAPKGSVVEFGYAEQLRQGRVAPWTTLSNGASCNFDHLVAQGGVQTFEPTTPKGGRYLEVHVIPPAGADREVRFVTEEFVERCYHGDVGGSFECEDDLLNRVWSAGAQAYAACAEDAVIDNPTRERGQWTGDALVGLETAAVGFGDLSLIRRMLVLAGRTTRKGPGFVQCLSPTPGGVIPSFAAMWVTAAFRYHRYTGDADLLRECFDDAKRNMAAFAPYVTGHGLDTDKAGWSFIDWGYRRPEGRLDLSLNIHFLTALRHMYAWAVMIDRAEEGIPYYDLLTKVHDAVRAELKERVARGGWEAVGYHGTALALYAHMLEKEDEPGAIAFVKRHILSCFPNRPDGPRLSDPSVSDPQLITPFFAHFAFPPLIERGEMDFVLDQYRKCWGWMLDEVGATTCLEVFDTRWSHCHQWSACPTWQLTRYGLGLHPRYDRGMRHFELNLQPGSLQGARGKLPLRDGDVQIEWKREGEGITYCVNVNEPIWIHPWNQPQCVEVKGDLRQELPARPPGIHEIPTWVDRLRAVLQQ